MKKFFTLLLLGLITLAAKAQDPLSSQYMFNAYLVNPAASATDENLAIMGGYRNQWTGFEGAPITYYVAAYIPTYKIGAAMGSKPAMKKLHGRTSRRNPRPVNYGSIGFMASGDNIGPWKDMKGTFSYAYNMVIGDDLELVAGAAAGFKQKTLNSGDLTTYVQNDPTIANYSYNQMGFESSVGLWLYSTKMYGGISAHRISTVSGIPFTNFFLTAGSRLHLDDNEVWSLVPSTMLRVGPPQPVQADLNLKLWYKDGFWIGASGRTNLTAVGLIGFRIMHTFALGYSYDVPFSEVKNLDNPSHEVWIEISPAAKGRVICAAHFW